MKTFKKVLSLAVALVMVVGALVVLPTDVKAASIATLTSTADANAETGKYGFKLSDYCSDYVDGADYKITVVLSSDGAAGSFGGGIGAATQLEGGWTQQQWDGAGATTTAVLNGTKLHEDRAEVQVWWLGTGNSVTIESITVEKITGDDAKAIHTFTGTGPDNAFTINPAQFCEGYADGKDYVITVKMTSDAQWSGMIGGTSNSTYDWTVSEELRGNKEATWTFEIANMYGSPKVEMWWIEGTSVVIEEITIAEKVAETPDPNPGTPDSGDGKDEVEATGDFGMALPLVLVLFGGAAVIVASKKRFA